jgi:hydrogenase maturation protein HypF
MYQQINKSTIQRKRITVNGIVQGVGFRPYIFKLARELNLVGFVSNSSSGVNIEIEGSEQTISSFLERFPVEAPPLSYISEIQSINIEPQHSESFTIRISESDKDVQTLISPDVSICDDCLHELMDKSNRRLHYPFINCTNCGPRYTIISTIPYDRSYTSMAKFKMCPDCQREYDDPANRRFHAQPNACPVCGPKVWYENNGSTDIIAEGNECFKHAVDDLIKGKIVAIKGLGGFHLSVDATNEIAVARLRDRKNREEKPLAIMVEDFKSAEKIVYINAIEKKLLISEQRPIVLLKKRNNIPVVENVAPGNKRLGVMLPYTPLHYILFEYLKEKYTSDREPILVMTSANLSEEPIAVSNEDARERLANIADTYLIHNRDILIRADDSVMIEVNDQPVFFRRSRGYVPRPVFVKENGPSILAVGAELKNTICLLKSNRAFLSQHIGDLENLRANEFFTSSIEHLQKIFEIKPKAIVHDLHPGYFSTQWAKEQKSIPLFGVQHHHAHLTSVMAEWRLDEPVIGIILDGTGYGYDKTIWGGEVLQGDYLNVKRVACFEPMPLPGGDAAIKEPWRIALAYLYHTYGKDLPKLPFMKNRPIDIIQQMINKNINCIMTSSCGRLFDAVAAMSGGRTEIRYEAQAAIEMMQSVNYMNVKPFPFETDWPHIPIKPILAGILDAIQHKTGFEEIAARFHKTLIELFTQIAIKARKQSEINIVVLSGGVFQNEILSKYLGLSLQNEGFKVYQQKQVPPNDGGISLGQVAIGQKLMISNQKNVNFKNFVL